MKRALIIFLILLIATALIPFTAVVRDKKENSQTTTSLFTEKGAEPLLGTVKYGGFLF